MPINAKIFKEYDIRGVYPNEINKEAAYKIGRAFCVYLGKKNPKIIMGRDVRLSSPELSEAFIKGCLIQGGEVSDIGIVTTPALFFSVNLLKADAGAIITASHNPSEYNGIKLVGKKAVSILPKELLNYLKAEFLNKSPQLKKQGFLKKVDIISSYVDFLSSFAKKEINGQFRLVADASNGAAGEMLKLLLNKLEISYWPLFFELDGNFPNHSPNPLEKKSQQKAKELIIHRGADFGFVLDADGDRIVFLDEKGKEIRGDLIIAFLADYLVKKGDRVLTDSAASRIVFDVAKEKGAEAERARTGHLNIEDAMRKKRAPFGGEVSGHYYFKDFFFSSSALFTLICVLNILSGLRKTLSCALEPYEKYFHSREYNFKIKDQKTAEKIIVVLKKKYLGGKQSFIDGLTVEYPEWWFNIRPSHTEPIIRLNIEADEKFLLQEKIKELTSLINAFH
ncbi:MAG: phosphomannomutase/phosphoglucomutase [Candidatus Niyogibacteria bacterium]|nr:phosphomannomutase/phosphoglucomutase [Candidatus Niyogibacteria bacterium]